MSFIVEEAFTMELALGYKVMQVLLCYCLDPRIFSKMAMPAQTPTSNLTSWKERKKIEEYANLLNTFLKGPHNSFIYLFISLPLARI